MLLTLLQSQSSGQMYMVSLSDTSNFSDSFAIQQLLYRAFSDTSNFSDSFAIEQFLYRSLSDTSNFSDSLLATKVIIENLSDTSNFSDSFSKILEAVRNLSDTSNLSDTLARVLSIIKNLSDTSNFSDSLVRKFEALRTLSDTSNLSDSLGRVYEAVKSLSDTSNFSDSLARVLILIRALSDTSNLSDSLARIYEAIKPLSDTSNLSDTLTRIYEAKRTLSDTSNLSDSLIRILEAIRNPSDTSNLSDSLAKTLVLIEYLSDTSNFSDVFAYLASSNALNLSETFTTNDLLAYTLLFNLVEIFTTSDSIAASFPLHLNDKVKFNYFGVLGEGIIQEVTYNQPNDIWVYLVGITTANNWAALNGVSSAYMSIGQLTSIPKQTSGYIPPTIASGVQTTSVPASANLLLHLNQNVNFNYFGVTGEGIIQEVNYNPSNNVWEYLVGILVTGNWLAFNKQSSVVMTVDQLQPFITPHFFTSATTVTSSMGVFSLLIPNPKIKYPKPGMRVSFTFGTVNGEGNISELIFSQIPLLYMITVTTCNNWAGLGGNNTVLCTWSGS